MKNKKVCNQRVGYFISQLQFILYSICYIYDRTVSWPTPIYTTISMYYYNYFTEESGFIYSW